MQKEFINTLDEQQDPAAVCDALAMELTKIEHGEVDPADLSIQNRVSKRVEEYSQNTRNVAALERAEDLGTNKNPGENVSYVVVDDEKSSSERVRLDSENLRGGEYDAEFYRDLTVRAADSVLSPLGWRRSEIEAHLSDREDAPISAY